MKDTEIAALITEMRAENQALRDEMKALRAVSGVTAQTESVTKAIAQVLREELRPTMDDRMGKRERREGEPRTFIPAVSPITGAKFVAVLREDGTCERLDEYQYPEMRWTDGDFLFRDGKPTDELTQAAKYERYKQTQMRDIVAYVSRDKAFPVEARADMQPKLEALRAAIADETRKLTEAAGVAPTG